MRERFCDRKRSELSSRLPRTALRNENNEEDRNCHEKENSEHRVKSTRNPFRRDIHVASGDRPRNAAMVAGGTSKTSISTTRGAAMAATGTCETAAAAISNPPMATAGTRAAVTAAESMASVANAGKGASISLQTLAVGEDLAIGEAGSKPVSPDYF